MQHRIVMDLYWYPAKMYKQGIIESELCWNCRHSYGSFVHLMWNCPRVKPFWEEVFTRINLVTNSVVPKNAILVILGDSTYVKKLHKGIQDWILTALACAKKNVLKCWKASPPPSTEDWINDLCKIAAMEKIMAKRLKLMEKFMDKWSNFLELYAA